jgi:hypothetical protein
MDFAFVQTDDVIFTITLKAGKINKTFDSMSRSRQQD